jgi:hypothetical protein
MRSWWDTIACMTCYHPTKTKGDIGVMKAKMDMLLRGYMILQPETEHAPFDFVAYKSDQFLRVQVKYAAMKRDGTIRARFTRRWCNTKGTQTRPIDKSAIDWYCVYCPDTDLCYYIDPKKYGHSVKLRMDNKRGGNGRSHPASDFGAIV